MTTKMTNNAQFCLHQVDRSGQYRLLRSFPPEKNEPASYSVEIARGTQQEMIKFKSEMDRRIRDIDGNRR